MTNPTPGQISLLRYLSIGALGVLFATDYGLDLWARDVPSQAYWIVGAAAIGVDANKMRDLLITFLESFAKKDRT